MEWVLELLEVVHNDELKGARTFNTQIKKLE